MKKWSVSILESSGAPRALSWKMPRVWLAALLLFFLLSSSSIGTAKTFTDGAPASEIKEQAATTSLTILVDDFKPQPYQGDTVYFFNRLNGDRGALNNGILQWGNGQVKATVSAGTTWTGIWESLNHPIREGLPLNFSSVLPPQILPAYQSVITGISVRVAGGTAGRPFRLELKDGSTLRWSTQVNLSGGVQVINSNLPALGTANQLVLVLDNAAPGDYVIVERISFTAATQLSDPETKAFVWSYGMLLSNWNPATGLVRDGAKAPSGDFDAIQSTGSLAAATALAEGLSVISRNDAVAIVSKIGDTLLNRVPRFHGLWPHWVRVSNGNINILTNEEWSSVDTVIAALGLLDAQVALGLNASGTEQMLKSIDWNDLQTPLGISHGYKYDGTKIPFAWDTFGGESWLTALAYAAATNKIAPIAYASPPTANGSGFIDELAWLFVPSPSSPDAWGVDWDLYRTSAAQTQILYYPELFSGSCLTQLNLFGLSAAEAPNPALVPKSAIYQAFGAGGRFVSARDGSALLGAPVVTPHYSAMLAPLRAREATQMWDWLIMQGYFSPLNNIESLMYLPANSGCNSTATFNDLKGSWNLALQTLGWGNYLSQKNGETPATWMAARQNLFLRNGYELLTGKGLDEAATQWHVFTEGTPTWAKNNAAAPSLDGQSLRCAITGGGPYSNVHCYRELPADPTSNLFTLNMSFYYQPSSTFNNSGGPSVVQALEFTMNKWHEGQRYEWALQWDNVDTGAPKWRYWGRETAGGPLKWIDLGIPGVLAGEQWHALKLEGEILTGKVHYQRFSIDGQSYPINIQVAPASAFGEQNRLAVAVQLDGNSMQTPYEVFLDHVTFAHRTAARIDATIGGPLRGTYVIPTGESTRQSYPGIDSGPVKLASTNGIRFIAAERVIYKVNGVSTSFTEMMGLPDSQLDNVYWLPWYNNVDLDTQLRIANVSASPATVTVTIGGMPVAGSPFNLAAGASRRLSFTGVNRGPVKIVSTQNIVAAERVIYKVNGVNSGFSEMMGLPEKRLSATYWLPWYNNVDLDTQLRIANVSGSPATVTVTIGGVPMPSFNLAAGESTRKSFAGINNGPVKIVSTQNIVAAERVIYKVNGVNTSFSEMMAQPSSQLSITYWLPWYNNVDLDTQLRIANASNTSGTIHIYIGGAEVNGSPFTLAAGASTRRSFTGINNGPVQIVSTQNIIAAERIIYRVNNINTSFTEMMALPDSQLSTTYWFPWYNNVSLDTQLRFGVP